MDIQILWVTVAYGPDQTHNQRVCKLVTTFENVCSPHPDVLLPMFHLVGLARFRHNSLAAYR